MRTYGPGPDVRVTGREVGVLRVAQKGQRNGLGQRLNSDDVQIAGDDRVNHFDGVGLEVLPEE